MSQNEIISRKIAFIKEQISEIDSLIKNKSREEILKDSWLIKGLKYSLQTAIEAMIDITYHICAKHFKKAPVDARDGLGILLENNLITERDFLTFSQMVGFRNRVVHGYEQVSAERVYELAANELLDFNRFIDLVLEYIRKAP
ncbi:type VII toxin-antitoxin system HepT family RNase toxin [Thermosediminibacter oceani]|uniref:DUF86 domain-containing protein n=1 Tax=Thermosediminibacter oceani (strain ATCC BAA-1034 / DSM 16646 / JW/IW-1228P) TaxID=555079 RepID=D9S0L7_THEOJ|nr:DUF86 domain-containing protein [Thermosediminibacter oceani]ADL08875.1 protein of unknown function DUF86 [Thermosediminibacter oceani DSM 16646]